jgi:murein DD-endopeptidase MepM/ murein hydrolase activator NlpD
VERRRCHTVGQGNNNASGSHNGGQSWAFDFGLPAGTEIRAARGGTVEWLQENLTATYNPNQPTGPGNQPFPGGSLQNWGNAVRIRHAAASPAGTSTSRRTVCSST